MFSGHMELLTEFAPRRLGCYKHRPPDGGRKSKQASLCGTDRSEGYKSHSNHTQCAPLANLFLRFSSSVYDSSLAARVEGAVLMMSAKEEVRRILEQIPEDVTFEDIQYHIYVRQQIARGLEDIDQGRVVSEEEAERRMSKW